METQTKNKTVTRQTVSDTKNEIVVNKVIDLPVKIVWQYLTDPEMIKKWWGPKNYICPSSTVDLKAGGKYLYCMVSPKGDEFWSTGTFKEIIPNEKLVYTDSFSDEKGNITSAAAYDMKGNWPMELLVTISLEGDGEKTKLRLQHKGIPSEMQKECAEGWNESLDKIERAERN